MAICELHSWAIYLTVNSHELTKKQLVINALTTSFPFMECVLRAWISQASVSCVSQEVDAGREVGGVGGWGMERTRLAKLPAWPINPSMSSKLNT